MLVFSIAPIQASSQGILAPDLPGGTNGEGYADLAIGIHGRDSGDVFGFALALMNEPQSKMVSIIFLRVRFR